MGWSYKHPSKTESHISKPPAGMRPFVVYLCGASSFFASRLSNQSAIRERWNELGIMKRSSIKYMLIVNYQPTNQPTNQTHDQPAFLHKSWGKICQIEKNWPKNLLIHGCLILTPTPTHHPTSEKAPKGSTWRSCYEESCHNGGDWSMPPGPWVHSTHPPLRATATWPSKPWGWAKALS